MIDTLKYLTLAEKRFQDEGLTKEDLEEFEKVLTTTVVQKVFGSLARAISGYGARMLACDMKTPEGVMKAATLQAEAKGLHMALTLMVDLTKEGKTNANTMVP